MENISFDAKNSETLLKKLKKVLSIYEDFNCTIVFNEKDKLQVKIISNQMTFVDTTGCGGNKMTIEELAAIVREGFAQTNKRIDDVEHKVDKLDAKVKDIDQKVDKLDTEVKDIKQRVDKLDTEVKDIKQKIQNHDKLFKAHGWI
ncbi:coiled-coil domain-containing protein [[Mycoplasma] testudinis]|uniref:coiled-coil domain-containing protein n=1 Tax=[Mycoplasma] testudinis TaxID=33924 RepID=UPI00048186D7|nr:DUF5798 family protein [[Mycoplasma] testudinis]